MLSENQNSLFKILCFWRRDYYQEFEWPKSRLKEKQNDIRCLFISTIFLKFLSLLFSCWLNKEWSLSRGAAKVFSVRDNWIFCTSRICRNVSGRKFQVSAPQGCCTRWQMSPPLLILSIPMACCSALKRLCTVIEKLWNSSNVTPISWMICTYYILSWILKISVIRTGVEIAIKRQI